MVDKEYVLNLILSHFKVIKRVGNTYYCICPHHKDKNPSLHITIGEKKIIMDCKAGCDYREILADVGLKPEQLYYDYYEKNKESTNWRGFVESREKRKIEAVYNYVSCNDGSYCFTKLRLEGKKILYGKLANERFTYGIGHDTPRKSYKAIYGSLQAIQRAIKEGKPIFIPEGEKDVNTLTKQGYVSFTFGGVNDWLPDFAELVKGADVVILADNDEPGKQVANTILHDVHPVAKSAKIILPMPDIPKADISDYFNAGHTKEEFEQMINNAVTPNRKECVVKRYTPAEVKELLSYSVSQDKDGNIKSKKIIQSVRNNEIILENDCRFTGRLRFNEFSRQDYLIGNVPWDDTDNYRAWNSHDDSALFSIIQSDYGISNRADYFDAIKNVSMQRKFHPIKDILDSLEKTMKYRSIS